MSRYEQDIRRPMRRRDEQTTIPRGWFVSLLVVALLSSVITFVACTWWERYQSRKSKDVNDGVSVTTGTVSRHDSMTVTYTYNGEMIRYYVMTDPDTGVQYIVNDRGGMCVRERDDEKAL